MKGLGWIALLLACCAIVAAAVLIKREPPGTSWWFGPLSGYRWCDGARVSLQFAEHVSATLFFVDGRDTSACKAPDEKGG